tara:strand:- start:171 stop:617 length:447 start_codon:yes stop_codon:yes gene_type:complete
MNTNMRLFALILILIAPTWAVAQKFDEKLKLGDIGPLYVELMDHASNACWTNLIEAKSYAAGQIDIAGGKVVDTTKKAETTFSILIVAKRMDTGLCFGGIRISVFRLDYFKGNGAMILYSQYGSPAVNSLNFNTVVLDKIKEAVAEWR